MPKFPFCYVLRCASSATYRNELKEIGGKKEKLVKRKKDLVRIREEVERISEERNEIERKVRRHDENLRAKARTRQKS